jgi:hypothetical protein
LEEEVGKENKVQTYSLATPGRNEKEREEKLWQIGTIPAAQLSTSPTRQKAEKPKTHRRIELHSFFPQKLTF